MPASLLPLYSRLMQVKSHLEKHLTDMHSKVSEGGWLSDRIVMSYAC